MKMHKRYCLTMVVTAMMFVGCASKVAPQEGAVKRARAINALEEENKALTLRIVELESQISNITNVETPSRRIDAPLPVPVAVEFASGCEIRAGEKSETIIRLRTLDARGRFLQMTGPVNIVIAVIDDEGIPRQLADIDVAAHLFPGLLRDGFMGMAYAVPVPIEKEFRDSLIEGGKVMVRAEIYDPRLSSPLRVDELISVLPPRGGYNPK